MPPVTSSVARAEDEAALIARALKLAPADGETAANLPLEHTPLYAGWEMLSRYLAPYALNPQGWHPLRELLNEMVDYEALRLRSEEAGGRTEPLLAAAVTRSEWMASHLAVCLAGSVAILSVSGRG